MFLHIWKNTSKSALYCIYMLSSRYILLYMCTFLHPCWYANSHVCKRAFMGVCFMHVYMQWEMCKCRHACGCVLACMYACLHTWVYAKYKGSCMHACWYAYLHECRPLCMRVCTNHMSKHACMCICIHACEVCVHAWIFACLGIFRYRNIYIIWINDEFVWWLLSDRYEFLKDAHAC